MHKKCKHNFALTYIAMSEITHKISVTWTMCVALAGVKAYILVRDAFLNPLT